MSPLIYGAGFSDGDTELLVLHLLLLIEGGSSSILAVSQTKKKSEVILDFFLSHPTSNVLEILQAPPSKQIQNHPLPTISTAEFYSKNPSCLLTWLPAATSDDSVYSPLRSQSDPFFFKSIRSYRLILGSNQKQRFLSRLLKRSVVLPIA